VNQAGMGFDNLLVFCWKCSHKSINPRVFLAGIMV
jgi:hypothetical protein